MRKIVIIILLMLIAIPSVYAKNEKVTVYVFTKANENISTSTIDYLQELKSSEIGDYFDYIEYQIWDSNWQENAYYRKLADKVAETFEDEILGAPYIVIGQNYKLAAFAEEYEAEIKNAIIEAYLDDDYYDIVEEIKTNIDDSKKYDIIAIIGIPLFLIAAIGILIYYSRKNLKA